MEVSRKRTVEEEAADIITTAPPVVSATGNAEEAAATAAAAAAAAASEVAEVAAAATAVAAPPPPAAAAAAEPATKPAANPKPAKMARTDKPYKGLRHFSMMVCKKVEEKGTTSYNEVADELVTAVIEERRKEDASAKYDEKNIRRRVYDALNVLMAMDIISKDKKEITWKGLPSSASQDLEMLQRELHYQQQEVERKREALRELLVQQVCFRNLVDYNQRREKAEREETAAAEEEEEPKPDNKIPLPFIVVNTHSSAVIQCNMSRDLTDVMFEFSTPFEINDDNTILKRLGM
jgi:transcription factor Dp-1